ncbi:phosphonate C-P lyase system protein PhnH [Roseomonas elaeocarpi]|uniref:Phosphonate C-P lyase system protein PhnH n=1 Tax=Roseomonas elaeocarpi TaxID=907779 RepID=A0ABV6JRH0_9PROT
MSTTSTLTQGFTDPVRDAQAVFRAVMEATARPGTIQALRGVAEAPAPLTPELAAVALALADHEAPVWLDPTLAEAPAVAAFLRFHTGAPITADPAAASFALLAAPASCPPHTLFAQGTPDYPDRSATLVLAVDRLEAGSGWRLEGPGIDGQARLVAAPLPGDMLGRLARNRALFPRGLDHLLVATGRVAAIPRSTVVTEG